MKAIRRQHGVQRERRKLVRRGPVDWLDRMKRIEGGQVQRAALLGVFFGLVLCLVVFLSLVLLGLLTQLR